VVEFLGGTPKTVPEHYEEADPMRLSIPKARQFVVHGSDDDTVPLDFSSKYVAAKKKRGESVTLIEIPKAGHFDLIDPRSAAWPKVVYSVKQLMVS